MKQQKNIFFISAMFLSMFLLSYSVSLGALSPESSVFDAVSTADTSSSSSSSACPSPTNIGSLFEYVLCLLSSYVIPFLIGLGVIMFLAGVLGYVRAGDNEEKRAAGRDLMWFGIIALFVMVSVWGLVGILFRSFFPNQDLTTPSLPKKATSVFQQY